MGSHEFPGSALHSNLLNHDLGTGGVGAQDVAIPVREIEPQSINKDMTATQDTDFAWNITKGPMPASLNFGDTCDPGNDLEEQVEIVVEWEILPGMPGMVMVVTNIYATNPAARTIRVDVSDEIFGNIGNGDESLDVLNCDPVDVPPNMTQIVCTHVFDAPANVTNLQDTATATYIDVVTGVPVPGETTAMASAPIQPGTDTNTTAIITDTESISGNGLEYALDFNQSVLPPGECTVGGSPYVPDVTGIGPPLGPGDSDLICVTDPAVEVSGSATAFKIVTLDEPRITTGTLSDTADLTASDGFTASASASVNISSNATVALTINKTIPDILQDQETITCNFTVTGPNSFEEPATINFGAGQTSGSAVLSGLEPGLYAVTEGECGGLVSEDGNVKTVDIQLPSCSGEVSFNNIPGAGFAVAEVNKVTLPVGSEDGWEMTLTGPGTNGGIMLTTSDGDPLAFEQFPFGLEEGDYMIKEMGMDGWDQTMVSTGCSFSVNYPADFGQIFQCTIENTQRGKIIVKKETDPDGAAGSFDFTGDLTGSIGDGGMLMSDLIVPGTYSVVEDDPTPAFDLIDITCDDDVSDTPSFGDVPTRKATFEVDPGETVTCTYTNRQRGMVDLLKLTNGAPDPNMAWSFTLNGPEVNVGDSTPPTLVDFDMAKLIPGETYTLCETGIPPSWTIQWALDANDNGIIDDGETLPFVGASTGNPLEVYDPTFGEPGATNDTRCVDFTTMAAETLHFIIDNQRPGGEPRTPGYWKNWNTCTGGNQVLTAEGNGGVAEGWFLLDDLIPTMVGDLYIETCEDGVLILDHRDLNGKKRASDAAYNLARNLLAAKLNLAAGAETCQEVVDAVAAGDALLSGIGFDGFGSYLRPKRNGQLYQDANALATTLDEYNNGELCQ